MSLTISNLYKSFDGKVIFENFSYTFNDTGLYLLKGESGRGKTTLFRLICGLDKEYRGTILDGGIKNVSFAFQEYRLFPNLTLLENILVIRDNWSVDEIEAVKGKLRFLGFEDSEFNLLPHEMSGGMKQRTSVLRALFKPTKILLLDEPTKEVDAALVDNMIELIKEEAAKRLVLMITHIFDNKALSNAEIIEI